MLFVNYDRLDVYISLFISVKPHWMEIITEKHLAKILNNENEKGNSSDDIR
jgi:hypothetical protein